MPTTTQNKLAGLKILRNICDTIIEVAEIGIPSGKLYAQLMPMGITLDQYNSIISALEKAGKIKVKNHFISR